MRNIQQYFIFSFLLLISGCELLCQAGTGTCGMSREEAQKLLHPKTYGEYWVKPGISKENWRLDWVDCGGMKDGGYSSDAPSGSSTAVLITSSENKTNELTSCMQLKGYEFRR
jgi:hypothetical protein